MKTATLLIILALLLAGCASDKDKETTVKKFECPDGRLVLSEYMCYDDETPEPAVNNTTPVEPIIEEVAETENEVNNEADAQRVFEEYTSDKDYSIAKVEYDREQYGKDFYKITYVDNVLEITSIMYVDSEGGLHEQYLIL